MGVYTVLIQKVFLKNIKIKVFPQKPERLDEINLYAAAVLYDTFTICRPILCMYMLVCITARHLIGCKFQFWHFVKTFVIKYFFY